MVQQSCHNIGLSFAFAIQHWEINSDLHNDKALVMESKDTVDYKMFNLRIHNMYKDAITPTYFSYI